jgi:polyhydroxybutyrate depolymerase
MASHNRRKRFVALGGTILALLVVLAVVHRVRAAPPNVDTAFVLPSGTSVWSMRIGNDTRTFRVHVPESFDPMSPAPLLIMLHGGFGSGRQAERAYGWDQEADAYGFIVAYPNGLGRAWNAGGGCCGKPGRSDTDDVAFISAMIAAIERHAAIDTARIFATGISNGGIMAYRLACETNLFAAIAPVAATMLGSCEGPQPLSVLHIHGLVDERVPFDGSRGAGTAHIDGPPVADVVAFWQERDDCLDPGVVTIAPITTAIATCPENRSVVLIAVADAGHQWPGARGKRIGALLGLQDRPSTAFNATDVIWQFFAAHRKPAGA